MKELGGRELAAYVKERQAREVRSLRQSGHVEPKLGIVVTVEHPAIEVYMRMKQQYGADINAAVDIHRLQQPEVPALLDKLNAESTVHGIIVQLPLAHPEETDAIVNLVAPNKDVDALGKDATFDPATPMAILWLLAGHNISFNNKKVILVGRGKLVGKPLEKILRNSRVDVEVADRSTTDLKRTVLSGDIIITATGIPSLLHADMFKLGAVVVDAGVASEGGKTVGDLAPDVYERTDLMITPPKGGVGPLTICALFENVIRAARQATETT